MVCEKLKFGYGWFDLYLSLRLNLSNKKYNYKKNNYPLDENQIKV